MKKIIIIFLWLFFGGFTLLAQPCTSTIAVFPYLENFETSDGGWLPGGTLPDWAWGAPSKTVISGAASGNNCWIVGGLSNTSYNNGENSWLVSPCFDFSGLTYPQISFNLFWETERRFDGASVQYSTDGGNNWTILGSDMSNSNCQGENWFNSPAITYLGNAMGWSGNIQPGNGSCLGGSGSAAWLTAKHSLGQVAGQPSVRFRFRFGAGTTCNQYDGFAVDDIRIEEAQASVNDITSTCISTTQVSFSASASCITGYAWNFDDAASGAANTSTAVNPAHVFSSPGVYNVTLTANFASGPPVVSTKQVLIISLNSNTEWPGRCIGVFDATLSVTPVGGNGTYFYYWDTNPAQTSQSISVSQPGTYTATVSAVNACNATSIFVIPNSPRIDNVVTVNPADCGKNNGSIFTSVTGGSPPYQYLWSDGSTGTSLQNLAPGLYDVDVTDAGNCFIKTFNITVARNILGLVINLGDDIGLCPGETVVLSPGTFQNYLWQDGTSTPVYKVSAAGTYFVQVSDAEGCVGSDTLVVKEDCSAIYFPSAFSPNNDGSNDLFGPLGNLAAVKNFSLSIYNRYGQPIFASSNPLTKWDGSFKGERFNTGNFVWIARFSYNGKFQTQKGQVLLIR